MVATTPLLTSANPGLATGSRLPAGDPTQLGSRCVADGVLFAVHSTAAEQIELCLFDAAGNACARYDFDACDNGVWHGFLPEAQAGLRYGFRAHGKFAPEQGLYFNPKRLLVDPYARALAGEYIFNPANHVIADTKEFATDNAAYVPHSVVVGEIGTAEAGVRVSHQARVIYEAHVAGLTRLNPAVAEALRGSYGGVATPAVINHLRALGVTSLQLLPVHSFIDEPHLLANNLSNYWGYNSLNFFTPHAAYANSSLHALDYDFARRSFRDMVRALHDANIEVLLDVVYNHTCEGGADGPTLSYRGLDNLSYYRTDANNKHSYINDTGCGNTLNSMSPVVQRLTLDSLRYFAQELEVDGFRFDLAVSLGREPEGFSAQHELFGAIQNDDVLADRVLIAEPWDVGPGGYQTGGFPAPWLEWNDQYRDALRSYWRGDAGAQAELGKRLHGSSDLFENGGRGVAASVNFVTSHDGFTLADVVAFSAKHNEANCEDNRDGHAHNLSDNMGVEGIPDDTARHSELGARRDRRSRAILATLMLSQGTPMLLAGDELRNSQQGNNNAYCQNNEIGWLQWDELQSAHVNLLRRCADVRASLECFKVPHFVHELWDRESPFVVDSGEATIGWVRSDGANMQDGDWHAGAAACAQPFGQLLAGNQELVLIALNPTQSDCEFEFPVQGAWQWLIDSQHAAGKPQQRNVESSAMVGAQSLSLFRLSKNSVEDSTGDSPISLTPNRSVSNGTSE